MTLSDTQSSILQRATKPCIAGAHAGGFGTARASTSWKLDGDVIGLSITAAGRQAIGAGNEDPAPASDVEPGATDEAAAANDLALPAEPRVAPPRPQHRPKLRDTAAALLACWDATTEREPLVDAVAALRAALGSAPRPTGSARGPRQGTKQQAVLTLLRRPEGATIANVAETTGWAQHTVRGFFASLKKKGHTVEVLDRVHKNGPGSAGAKGSYSIYRLGEAG